MSLSIPEIVEAVAADFTARNIAAEVLFGTWEVSKHNGANRVIIGLDTFEYDAPGPPNAPGVQFLDQGQTMGARSLMSRVQNCIVWVHGAPPADPKTTNRAIIAHQTTCDLLHATLAALYRACHGSFGWGGGQWPKEDRVPGFLYGSLATFRAQFWIPVLDDAYQAIQPDIDGSTMNIYASFPPPTGDQLIIHTP